MKKSRVNAEPDALTYVRSVRAAFADNMLKFQQFLKILDDYKHGRIYVPDVIEAIKELFRGHRDLILGFNYFIPQGYDEIELPLYEEQRADEKPVEFQAAISFVNKVKIRFQGEDSHVYKSFLDILNQYRAEHKGLDVVYQEVFSLFQNHMDLFEEFVRFCPNGTAQSTAEDTDHHDENQPDDTHSGTEGTDTPRL